MAAPLMRAVSSALKGVHFVPGRWLLAQSSRRPAGCRCLPLNGSTAASLCSSRTEPQHQRETRKNNTDEEEEEEEEEGPEYIPKKKAKNPMMVIGYAWMIGLPTGIIGFLLAKREVDKNRLKQLKIRQRMSQSNEGEYEGSRYRHQAEDVKLDQ